MFRRKYVSLTKFSLLKKQFVGKSTVSILKQLKVIKKKVADQSISNT